MPPKISDDHGDGGNEPPAARRALRTHPAIAQGFAIDPATPIRRWRARAADDPHHADARGSASSPRSRSREAADRLEAEHDRAELLRPRQTGGGARRAAGAHARHPASSPPPPRGSSASPASTIEPAITTARRSEDAAHSRAASTASASGVHARAASALLDEVGDGIASAARRVRRRREPRDLAAAARRRCPGILVGEHTEHETPLVEVEAVVERTGERGRTVRVVRGITTTGRRDADQLQPARRGGVLESVGRMSPTMRCVAPPIGTRRRDRECGVVPWWRRTAAGTRRRTPRRPADVISCPRRRASAH